MTIWICESGDYEQRGIDLAAVSVESGIAALKKTYGDPYVVSWGDPVEVKQNGSRNQVTIVGIFASVTGYSIKHDCEYTFSEYDLHDLQ